MYRSKAVPYGITLLMMACDGGAGPMRAENTSAVETSEPDGTPMESEGGPEAEEETVAEPAQAEPAAPEEPDAIGLPCEVKRVLWTRCQGCHGVDAKNGTPLLSRDNLMAISKKDPMLTVIERALMRTTAVDKPMPPTGKGDPLTAEELFALNDWLEHGAQAGRCDSE
jgi:mono/diheme cytochrome c family protein